MPERRACLWTRLTALALVLSAGCNAVKRFGYEGFDRDDWQQPERVVEALQIAPGSRVADLGAGGGYFTFRLADAVGPEGVVYAVDVDPGMTEYIAERAKREGYANVAVIEATADDPKLAPGSIDLVFTCNTYHHIPDRPAYFERLTRALAPGGRVAIVEYEEEGFFARVFGHATGAEVIKEEMAAAGYRLEAEHDFLPRQGFLVFVPAA